MSLAKYSGNTSSNIFSVFARVRIQAPQPQPFPPHPPPLYSPHPCWLFLRCSRRGRPGLAWGRVVDARLEHSERRWRRSLLAAVVGCCFAPPSGWNLQSDCSHFQSNFTRSQLGPFFVLKFVRSWGFGARFLQPFPKSLVTVKAYSNTKKWPVIAVNGR